MSRLGARLDRLGGQKRCPVCRQPNPPRESVEVRSNVRGLTEEEVHAIREGTYEPPAPREPERCTACGRQTEMIIRMPGLYERSRGDGYDNEKE